jgi:hypothetical protein
MNITNSNFRLTRANILGMKEVESDCILALNLFHHFLKTEESFKQLKDLLNETKIHSYYLGYRSDYLRSMAFTDDLMINTRNYVKHPVYWILWKSFSGQGEEKNILEWSKEYNEVMNLAEINNGCVRFYRASEIPHLLNEENDVLCLLNDRAAPYINSIKTIASKVQLLDLRGRS